MTRAAIEVRGLRMRYGEVEAVKGIDLRVEVGEVFALLGPNGAGKTTAIEILEGYRKRSAGDVSVLGVDPVHADSAFRSRIGLVLQELAVEPYLTVQEALAQRAAYYARPRRVDEVLDLVGLEDSGRSSVKRLSGGQQRRLDLALALIGDPELLFLDEPTTGFDPAARRAAWEVIAGLAALDKSIVLTTHYMEEASALAGRVAVMVGGRIVAEGPPTSLAGRDQLSYEIRFRLPTGLPADRPSLPGGALQSERDVLLVRTEQPTAVLHQLTDWAVSRRIELEDLNVSRPSLEEVYLELTESALGAEVGS
jgi:ABC-2 type transport system ATP-binding protein